MPPTKETIIGVLRTVMDPELQMDIWTLGLIYDITIADRGINIRMTLTTPLCPYGPALVEEVRAKLSTLAEKVIVELVFEPPWQPPDELRIAYGI